MRNKVKLLLSELKQRKMSRNKKQTKDRKIQRQRNHRVRKVI